MNLPQQDSEKFRELVCRLLPGLTIEEVARPSGQRIVYFGTIENVNDAGRKVWKGCSVENWGRIVVKVSSGITPEAITYLQREIHTLNCLESDFYPTLFFNEVYSVDPQTEEPLPERLFITIEEFIPSQPLSDYGSAYSTEESVVALLIQLVEALRLLWEQKPPLVHRDLKPDNILIRADGTAAIIDLGIVRVEGADGVTKTEFLYGPCTPQYSSPEQARNDKKNISFKSDVFALGTLSHVLLTGSNPFQPAENMTIVDVLSNVSNLEPESLNKMADVSETFAALVQQMMQKEPYRRPRTADVLLNSLTKIRELHNGN